MKLKSNKYDKYLVFSEDFRSVKTVVDNGGTISGTPTISNKVVVTSDASQKVVYKNLSSFLSGKTKATFAIDFITPTDTTNTSVIMSVDDTVSGRQLSLRIVAGKCRFYFLPSASYGEFDVSPTTKYRVVFVYDGSKSTNDTKLICYLNAVATTLTFSGTIDTFIPYSPANLACPGEDTAVVRTYTGLSILAISIYRNVSFTAEEVLDFYQNDTYTEIDTKNAQIFLPLKSAYYQSNGVQLLVDGNMEAAGTTAWTSGSSAVLTKETTNPFSGIRVLRITGGGAVYPWARQDIMAVNRMYRVRGMCRGDGNLGIPRVSDDTAQRWIGTNSTSWQSFDILFSPTVNGNFYLTGVNTTGYCEFDNVTVEFSTLQSLNKGTLVNDIISTQNVNPYPDTFTTSFYTKYNGSFTGNVFVDTIDGSSQHHYFMNGTALTAPLVGKPVKLTARVKAGTKNWIIVFGSAGAINNYFNLTTGDIGSGTGTRVATIEDAGNGYWDCSIIFTCGSLTGFGIEMASSDGVATYVGDGTGTINVARLDIARVGTLGDGVTFGDGKDATFTPSLLPLNGVLMNGTSFINTNLLTDSVQANTPFTVTTYIKNFNLVPGINHGLLGTIDSTQDYRGWEVGFVNIGGARLRFLLFNAYSTSKYLSIYASINSRVNGTVTVTYDGSGVAAGVKIYQNGEQLTTTTEIDAVAGLTLSNGKPALLGGRWAGTVVDSKLRSGAQIKYPTFYNFALTPSQVRAAHKNILNLINQ